MNHKFHNRVLNKFAEEYYSGLIDKNHLIEEIVVDDEAFWYAIRNGTKYLIPRSIVTKLPIKVVDTAELRYRGKVYYVVNRYQTIVFKKEKSNSFREIVDDFCKFEHTNDKHFLLYKLICMASYLDRVNFRVATNAGFGKDSVWEVLHLLKRDVSVVNPRSMPALEYRLFNTALVLNELSNLESSQRDLVQEFLLLCGDMRMTYEKSTRAVNNKTQDIYDIKGLSLVCMFNDYKYYEEIGKDDKFFDNVFTKAVHDRLMPFKFTGRLQSDQFRLTEKVDITLARHKAEYIKLLRNLQFYKEHWRDEIKDYKVDIKPLNLSPRQEQTFNKLLAFINLYSKDYKEFKGLVDELYECHKEYNKMMAQDKWGDIIEVEKGKKVGYNDKDTKDTELRTAV